MKKILIVMEGFFPGRNYGGPPVSIDNFCTMMKEYKIYIVTTDHDHGMSTRYKGISHGWNDRGNCKVMYVSDGNYKYRTFRNICKKIEPDWVYLQGLFQSCIIPCLLLTKMQKSRVILATRGELCKGAFKKKWKKIPYIVFLRMFGLLKKVELQSTSNEETESIKRWLGTKGKNIHCLPNFPTLNHMVDKQNHKMPGEARIVFISRIVAKKNLLYALKRLLQIRRKIIFDIYGALEDERYWAECRRIIELLPKNIKASYCGVLEHNQVMKTFQSYDAFLFPTLSENYGHVIVEALQSGCPVIISTETPWRNLKENGAGWDIKLENEGEYEEAIDCIADADSEKMERFRLAAVEYVNSRLELTELKKAYRDVFDSAGRKE